MTVYYNNIMNDGIKKSGINSSNNITLCFSWSQVSTNNNLVVVEEFRPTQTIVSNASAANTEYSPHIKHVISLQ